MPRSGATGGEYQNVFDELKNQWGFAGFCSQKTAVSQSSTRMLLVYNLWNLFVRVLKNRGGHTEAVKSRYELLLIPAKLVLSGRRKTVKLAVGGKFANFLKQAYQRFEKWLKRTAPQLSLSSGKPAPWLLFAPLKPLRQPSHDRLATPIRFPTSDEVEQPAPLRSSTWIGVTPAWHLRPCRCYFAFQWPSLTAIIPEESVR